MNAHKGMKHSSYYGCYHQHSNALVWCDCMYKEQYSQLKVMGMHLWLQWMHFKLIFCSWCPRTKQITEQSIISLQPTKEALLDTLYLLVNLACKWAGVLAQAIQLTAVQDVDVALHVLSNCRHMLQWTNSIITIMVSSFSYFMGTIILCTLSLIFDHI